jgi:putative endonuclease
MYFVYILTNPKEQLYKGITNNIERRIAEHNNNESPGTRGKGPWKLIYSESCLNRKAARVREKYFKLGQGREYIHEHMLK